MPDNLLEVIILFDYILALMKESYIFSLIKVMDKLKLFVISINLIAIFICIYKLVGMGFFEKYGSRFPYDIYKADIMCNFIIVSSLNIFCLCKSKPLEKVITHEREPSIFSLWLKRKRLEHLAKIKELEK